MSSSRRRTLGGRGREWAQRCYKLLEEMCELHISKPFRNPVNELQYPDYYSIVKKHMDLSKVQMNIHTGMYSTPRQFAEDIELIVSNWKAYIQRKDDYIKDKESQLHSQVNELAWFFKQEFEQITALWEGKTKRPKLTHVVPTPATSTPIMMTPASVNVSSIEVVPGFKPIAYPAGAAPISMEAGFTRNPAVSAPLPAAVHNGVSVSELRPSAMTTTVTPIPLTVQSSVQQPATSKKPSGSSGTAESEPGLEMKMEVTNVWFGPCRIKPQRLVHLSEHGIRVSLSHADKDIEFLIHAKEIVRALGHLNKCRKHTLFLFVTPSCDKRLRELATKHHIFGEKPKGEPCGLYAIFIKSLLPMQISRLIHIFWNISHNSIFSPVFSEVDQKGALSILANIKPQIMDRIVEKVTDTLQTQRTAVLGTAKAVPSVSTYMVSMGEVGGSVPDAAASMPALASPSPLSSPPASTLALTPLESCTPGVTP